MSRNYLLAASLLTTLLAYGCQTTGSPLSLNQQTLSLEQQAALALNTDYETALRTIGLNGKPKQNNAVSTNSDPLTTGSTPDANPAVPPAPPGNVFGPRIGHYFLADEYVVFRHARPRADARTEILQTVPVELTYFLVSPKGVIEDYAIGSSEVSETSCFQIYASQAIVCDQQDRLSEDFDRFDRAMLTSKGSVLSVWNVSANAADAQLFDPFVSLEQETAAQTQ